MEKQEFLMEVMDIMNGTDSDEIEAAAKVLTKEAIRTQARRGMRQYNISRNQYVLNINGVQIFLSEKRINNIVDFIKDEGFRVEENNGYFMVNW